jgi:hypothetical protein
MTSNDGRVEVSNGMLVTPAEAVGFAVGTMDPIDKLPPSWRALVYEYGRNITLAMRETYKGDLAEATFQLESWRYNRQEQLLAVNYFLKIGSFAREKNSQRQRGRASGNDGDAAARNRDIYRAIAGLSGGQGAATPDRRNEDHDRLASAAAEPAQDQAVAVGCGLN